MENWIETYGWHKVYPLNPSREEIDLHDIAHSLSQQCRFTGHTKTFYSVAAHSITCSFVVQKLFPNEKRLHFICLMHDASEAYLSDIAKPVKCGMPEYRAIERKLEDAVWDAFEIHPYPFEKALCKEVDEYVLAKEGIALMNNFGGWATDILSRFAFTDLYLGECVPLCMDTPMEDVEEVFLDQATRILSEIKTSRVEENQGVEN